MTTSTILSHKLSEFVKLAEVVPVAVGGLVKDDRTFNSLFFMKSKLSSVLAAILALFRTTFFYYYSRLHFQVFRCCSYNCILNLQFLPIF